MAELTTSSSNTSRRANVIVTIVAVMFILVPFLFWRDTWFGRELTDDEIRQYLADTDSPRKAQHVLIQISERMAAGDSSVKQWYPDVIELAKRDLAELRVTVAWLMGRDRDNRQFHDTLLTLLKDDEPLVRRNAALSLANFGDPAGRPILRSMLRPFTVTTPHAGKLQNRLVQDDRRLARNDLLARVEQPGGADEPAEVRSPVPGIVRERLLRDGSDVAMGDEIMVLDPDPDHIFQALRALFLVGTEEDIEDVRRFLRPSDEMPASVAQQARLTTDEIPPPRCRLIRPGPPLSV